MQERQDNISPKLHLLDEEQIQIIHNKSVEILDTVGIKVESKDAINIFKSSDAVRVKDSIVYISRELVENAIKTAPSNVEIFKKNGKQAFELGSKQGNETYFGIGVTNTYFQNIANNKVEPFSRKHMQYCSKFGDILPNYDIVSTLGIPSDVESEKVDLYATLDIYANTDKPLVLLISGDDKISDVFGLLNFLHDDICTKPFCIPYVNPITPLVLNKSTSDKIIHTIELNLPFIYSNYGMYGGTTPITESGSMDLLNAELLVGLVFSQLVKEGSSIILGSLPAAFNMSSMGSFYTPTSYLLNLACAEMMNYYEIPHCGTSGSSNGRGPDLLASKDLWLNHLTSCIGKIGCAPFVGGNFDSIAFSPTTVVLSDYIIGEARKFASGFSLSGGNIDFQEIKQVGHGGNYFTSDRTLNSLSEFDSQEKIWSSLSLENWNENNMLSAEKELIDFTKELYEVAQKESAKSYDIIKRGEDYINRSP